MFKTIDYLIKLKKYKANDFPIVYMDESGFEQYTLRPYGYAPIGERCLATYNWQAKKEPMSLGRCIKTPYSPLTTLSRTLIPIVSMTGVRTN